jgi:serine/threonine protein kinase
MTGLGDILITPDDYEKGESIGSGGYATVFEGILKCNGRKIAVKLLDHWNSEVKNQRAFVRELVLLNACRHTCVVPLIGFHFGNSRKNESPGLVTELMANGHMYEAIQKRVPGFNHVKRAKCVYGIAETMRFIHSKNVFHRDLKLSNVFLNDNMEPVIGDLGSAKLFLDFVDPTLKVGTFTYMAPEMCGPDPYGKEIDVFSFGVLIRKMFDLDDWLDDDEGKARTVCSYLRRASRGARLARPESIPDFYWELVQDCWKKNPKERPTFEAIVQRLRSHRSEYGMTTIESELKELEDYEKVLDTEAAMRTRRLVIYPRPFRSSSL